MVISREVRPLHTVDTTDSSLRYSVGGGVCGHDLELSHGSPVVVSMTSLNSPR